MGFWNRRAVPDEAPVGSGPPRFELDEDELTRAIRRAETRFGELFGSLVAEYRSLSDRLASLLAHERAETLDDESLSKTRTCLEEASEALTNPYYLRLAAHPVSERVEYFEAAATRLLVEDLSSRPSRLRVCEPDDERRIRAGGLFFQDNKETINKGVYFHGKTEKERKRALSLGYLDREDGSDIVRSLITGDDYRLREVAQEGFHPDLRANFYEIDDPAFDVERRSTRALALLLSGEEGLSRMTSMIDHLETRLANVRRRIVAVDHLRSLLDHDEEFGGDVEDAESFALDDLGRRAVALAEGLEITPVSLDEE